MLDMCSTVPLALASAVRAVGCGCDRPMRFLSLETEQAHRELVSR